MCWTIRKHWQILITDQCLYHHLILSCSQLRSGGSQILEGCVAEIPNISSLDISDNGEDSLDLELLWCCFIDFDSRPVHVSVLLCSGLDMDLTTLLVWLAKNRSIRHLSLGKNFNNIKSKWVTNWLQAKCCIIIMNERVLMMQSFSLNWIFNMLVCL